MNVVVAIASELLSPSLGDKDVVHRDNVDGLDAFPRELGPLLEVCRDLGSYLSDGIFSRKPHLATHLAMAGARECSWNTQNYDPPFPSNLVQIHIGFGDVGFLELDASLELGANCSTDSALLLSIRVLRRCVLGRTGRLDGSNSEGSCRQTSFSTAAAMTAQGRAPWTF